MTLMTIATVMPASSSSVTEMRSDLRNISRTMRNVATSHKTKSASSITNERLWLPAASLTAMLSAECDAMQTAPLTHPKNDAAISRNSSRNRGILRLFTT